MNNYIKNTGSSSCWSMELQTRRRWKSLFGLNTKSRRWHPPAKISAADFLFNSRITRGMPAWNNNKATHSSWETTNTLIQWWHQRPWWRIGRASRANKNNGRRALWKKKGGLAFVQGCTKKISHISTPTSYAMVAGERAINFLIAPQRQRRKMRQSWQPSRLLGTPKRVLWIQI